MSQALRPRVPATASESLGSTSSAPSSAPPSSGDAPTLSLHRKILQALAEHPNDGLSALYREFSRHVNRLVWRLLGADPDYDDIVQQVFFELVRSAHQVRDPDRLRAWINSVTVNVVRSELRRRFVRRAFLLSGSTESFHGDLHAEMETRDTARTLKEIIEKIPSNERIVFLLHQVEGLSLPEVAEACGHSLITAKRRLSKARKRFDSLASQKPELLAFLQRSKAS